MLQSAATKLKLNRKNRSVKGNSGVSLMEYALPVALVSVVVIGTISLVGQETEGILGRVTLKLREAFGLNPSRFERVLSSTTGEGESPTAPPNPLSVIDAAMAANVQTNSTLPPETGLIASLPIPSPGIVQAGGGVGIGGLIAAPKSDEKQICFDSGFCINVPKVDDGATVDEVSGGGLGGDLVHRLAATFDQLAAQLEHQNPGSELAKLIRNAASESHALGSYINDVDGQCQGARQRNNSNLCYDDDAHTNYVEQMRDSSQFYRDRFKDIETYFQNNPNHGVPGVQAILNFEHGQLNQIINGLETVQDASSNILNTSNKAKLTHQSGNTMCSTQSQTPACTVTLPP